MKSMALKCLCFMFRRNTCHFPVIQTVFGRLIPLIDDEDFPLHCRSNVLRILQKMFCGKAPSINHGNGSELSKLVLAAENSLRSSSWEMQGTALEILVEILCFLKQARPDLTITTLNGSSFAYAECQGTTNNMPLTYEENGKDRPLSKIITAIVNHSVSLVNQVISKRSEKVTSRNICISAELNKRYKACFNLMLKLITYYPSAAAVALDKLRCLVKELVQINDNGYSEVIVTCGESFQTSVALEELLATSIEASLIETDICKAKLESTEFNDKENESIVHDLILCTIRFANACHGILCKTSDARCNLHDCIKGLIECVHQNAPQYWSTYETFHMVMRACIAWNTCKIRDNNQASGDSQEERNILFTPVWISQELCALRMTKILIKKQKYWEAYRSSMYCCHEGLWFTASFVFRKLADAFEAGSFSFWFKSLLLFSAGEIEMKLLLFPSATVKLVGELKAEGDLSEDFNCTEIDADDTPSGSQELHGFRAKITGICGRTCLANDALASNASSDCEFFFQRWFIRLRLSFLEVLTDVLGIVSAQSSAYKAREDNLTVSGELMRDQILALAHCSLRLSDLAKSYDLLAAFHIDMDHHSFSSIARLAFMCSLLAFCTAYSVDFSKTYIDVEPCKLPKRFSHASILQDLHGRVDGSDRQIVSKLRQFMPTSFDELDCLQSSARMSCSCNLEKDSYSLFHFAVTSLLGVRGNAKSKGTGDGEDCLSALHGGLQFLSCILQKFMELPFMIPKYFFRVRPCLGAELYMFDSNPAHRHGILVAPGSNLSLTLCMQWKRVLERSAIRLVKLYCILAVSSEPSIDVAGTRSKQFEPHKIAEMVELNTKLLHYIKNDLRKSRGEKNLHLGTDMVTAFACFEPTDSGQGFSSCLLNVSSFPEGSYQIKWHACCVDENGSYFGLPPLNDGAVFSVRMS
uniref:Integrator complex subunit 7-like C-terminal domain-containing protein n=1 Tax=Arundo donax TaxID=35708 RepID=A0A0A9EB61_ARUDO